MVYTAYYYKLYSSVSTRLTHAATSFFSSIVRSTSGRVRRLGFSFLRWAVRKFTVLKFSSSSGLYSQFSFFSFSSPQTLACIPHKSGSPVHPGEAKRKKDVVVSGTEVTWAQRCDGNGRRGSLDTAAWMHLLLGGSVNVAAAGRWHGWGGEQAGPKPQIRR